MTMAAFLSYIGLISFYPFTKTPDTGFINLAIGWLGGITTTVIGWYFGGSRQTGKMFEPGHATLPPSAPITPTLETSQNGVR